MSKQPKSYHQAVAELNSKQREAFDEPGHTVLLAGPGSGKTATLVLKVARLLSEIPPPHGLACLTYGNEAAREFEQRLRALGVRPSSRLFMGTVHSFCLAHVLRPFASRLGPRRGYLVTDEIASDKELKAARVSSTFASAIPSLMAAADALSPMASRMRVPRSIPGKDAVAAGRAAAAADEPGATALCRIHHRHVDGDKQLSIP